MRSDIQFLRGIAVLFVVIYHSGLELLPHGYLGVDLFFVISGFLITKLVLTRLESNSFSFVDFYYRRARRLLPALYCTLIFTTILSIFFLTNSQLEDYVSQFIGALTFSANMVLPGQTGYFESAAEGKPLLHIWSLSLEEQYYFILPLALFLLPKKIRLLCLISAALISIIWCFNWLYTSDKEVPFLWRLGDTSKYEWAFYLLPTRAWELLAGSIAAWIYLYKKSLNIPQSLNIISLFTIVGLGFINLTPEHPDVESLLVVLSTSILLLARDNWLPKGFLIKSIEKVGDWSYSIYLVHWPLFAFAFLSFVGKVPAHISVFIAFLSVVLGYLQFKFVETPFRYKEISKLFTDWKPIAVITSLLIIIPIGLTSHPLYGSYASELEEIRQPNYGLGEECENSFDSQYKLKEKCKTSSFVNTVIWGDSYAMHLVPGLTQQNSNIAQITMSTCGPFLGIAPVNSKYNRQWAESCIEYNSHALRYILETESVEHVIISSPLGQYLSKNNRVLSNDKLQKPSLHLLFESYSKTVSSLHEAGKKVLFISPTPKDGTDIGECLERKYGPALMFKDNCSISKSAYFANQGPILKALKEFSNISKVYNLSEVLCDENQCITEINSRFIYRDSGHFSIEGSIEVLGTLKVDDLFD